MSATLTWRHAIGPKTGITGPFFFDDLNTMVTAKAADPNYKWQVASVNNVGPPLSIVLKRKDGSPGRFLLAVWVNAMSTPNPAILTGNPSANTLYQSYFPYGNTDTPLNLMTTSGTILGNDTSCNKMYCACNVGSIYTASNALFYFDSEEAIVFGVNNPASATTFMYGGGYLFVDASDNAYYGIIRGGAQDIASFSSVANSTFAWSDAVLAVGTASAYLAASYGAPDSLYYMAYIPTGNWASHLANATDILTDTANSRVAFSPVSMIGMRKCEGTVLKLRQIAHGPASTGPFVAYSSAGPTVQARQFCNVSAGSLSLPWFTNFKL